MATEDPAGLPVRAAVRLRRERLTRLLGIAVPDGQVTSIFQNLQMQVTSTSEGWTVVPPPHRFDIAIEEDLVEEVARIMGFDGHSGAAAQSVTQMLPAIARSGAARTQPA